MPLVPIAAFLAGALLSLLLPVLLLIALVVWYWMVSRREPEPGDASELPTAPATANPGPSAAHGAGSPSGASAAHAAGSRPGEG